MSFLRGLELFRQIVNQKITNTCILTSHYVTVMLPVPHLLPMSYSHQVLSDKGPQPLKHPDLSSPSPSHHCLLLV